MIYIACPAKYATGGTELLHQLYYKLKNYTENVRIYYIGSKEDENPVNDRFKKYEVKYVRNIDDKSSNIIIVPETATKILRNFSSINKSIWWLSVDNYYKLLGNRDSVMKSLILKLILILNREMFKRKVDFKDKNILHLYQSYYAKKFLQEKGVSKSYYLSDYIGSNFLSEYADLNASNRKNRVLYNPKKGIKFTKKIIAYDHGIEFYPLINMTQDQIIDLCKTSKVYIDFGNHPGKDRFPREAAHLGCIIITGKKGSAKFHEDVMIPEKFKFADNEKNIPNIVNEIKNVFLNYNDIVAKYNDYRNMIKNEENIFEDDVKKVWNKFLIQYSK